MTGAAATGTLAARRPPWPWTRPIAVGLTVAVGVLTAIVWYLRLGPMWSAFGAYDYRQHASFAQRFLDTGSMYLPSQLAGAYDPRPLLLLQMPSLYPPHTVYLFVPFLWLPAVLWWAIPLGTLAFLLIRWRPSPWTWPIMLALLLPQESTAIPVAGNTTMWMTAILAAGLAWGWPLALLSIKPTLLPFAIVGIRRRSFWAATAIVGLAALPFGTLWLDYFRAIENAHTSILYSAWSLPIMAIPLVAWAGRSRSVFAISVGPDRARGDVAARHEEPDGIERRRGAVLTTPDIAI